MEVRRVSKKVAEAPGPMACEAAQSRVSRVSPDTSGGIIHLNLLAGVKHQIPLLQALTQMRNPDSELCRLGIIHLEETSWNQYPSRSIPTCDVANYSMDGALHH